MAAVEPRRTGAALVFVILLMLGLLALTHGLLVAALSELAGSRAAERGLQLRAASERGLRGAWATVPGPWMDTLALWESWTSSLERVGSFEAQGTVQRLGPESWLLIGSGRLDGGATTETASLAWSLDPLERLVDLPGVVSVGEGAVVTVEGVVDASDPTSVTPPMQDGDCDAGRATLDARYGVGSVAALATASGATPFPGLGLLDFDTISAASPVRVAGTGTPTPVEALGACRVDDPWGWGDPDQPWRPCGAHLSFRAADGDLRVSGGVGQGLLVVGGDLALVDGARYYGLVVVRGALSLEGGAVLEGLAQAGSGLTVSAGSSLRGSACWAMRALSAQREVLGWFIPVAPGMRIGPL